MIEFDLPQSLPETPGAPPEAGDPSVRIADETAVEALKNDFIGRQQQILFTGDDALFRLEGDAALAGGPATAARLAEMRDGLLERTANPAQHTMLKGALDRHLALAGEDIGRHVDRQQRAWQRSVAGQRLDLLRRQVALDHTDPALLEGYARAGENAALDQARIDGLEADSGEARQLATQARSSLYRSAIESALAAGDHATASTLHEHASDRLAPADAASLEPELRLSRELQAARTWLAHLAPPPSPEPAAFFDAPRLLAGADAAHEAATAQNEADWSGNPTQRATNQHLIDVQFGKQKREIEQTRVRLDATVQDWLARPGADGEPQTERPPFAVWKQLGPGQQQSIDIILAQHARGPGFVPSPDGTAGAPDSDGGIAQAQQRPSIQTPATPDPNQSLKEQARQAAEAQRQKRTEERKAELERLARIKTFPRPTDKQFMPEDWEQRLSKATLGALDASAKRYNVPRELLARVLWQESGFKEDSGHKEPIGNAKGIAGLKDGPKGVKAELQRLAGLAGDRERVQELQGYSELSAPQAINMAAEYLRYCYEHGGRTWPGAIAGYNFGPSSFEGWISGRSDPTKSRSLNWGHVRGYLQYVFRGDPKAFDE